MIGQKNSMLSSMIFVRSCLGCDFMSCSMRASRSLATATSVTPQKRTSFDWSGRRAAAKASWTSPALEAWASSTPKPQWLFPKK